MEFTVSADGTQIASYKFNEVPCSAGCTTLSVESGDAGIPINNHGFEYHSSSDDFVGNFPGPQSATGTYQFHSGGTTTSTVTWDASTTAPPDTDGDGIPDPQDACPNAPAPTANGCPDSDGDGVSDQMDPCPNLPGPPGGCPDMDNDGVADPMDPCPSVPGFPGGCPPAPPPGGGIGGGPNPTDGNDTLGGTPGDDLICGQLGNDTITGFGGDDTLFGDMCGNQRRVSAAHVEIGGNDIMFGGAGDDRMFGSAGRDTLAGNEGDDTLVGGVGKDVLIAGAGNDTLRGGAGKNSYNAGSGNDRIFAANRRRENVSCGSGRDTVNADQADRVNGCERVRRARR